MCIDHTRSYKHIFTYTWTHEYTYTRICIYACVYICNTNAHTQASVYTYHTCASSWTVARGPLHGICTKGVPSSRRRHNKALRRPDSTVSCRPYETYTVGMKPIQSENRPEHPIPRMHASCMHACVHSYMRTCMHTCVHPNMHTCLHADLYSCIHVAILACMHTCYKC